MCLSPVRIHVQYVLRVEGIRANAYVYNCRGLRNVSWRLSLSCALVSRAARGGQPLAGLVSPLWSLPDVLPSRSRRRPFLRARGGALLSRARPPRGRTPLLPSPGSRHSIALPPPPGSPRPVAAPVSRRSWPGTGHPGHRVLSETARLPAHREAGDEGQATPA